MSTLLSCRSASARLEGSATASACRFVLTVRISTASNGPCKSRRSPCRMPPTAVVVAVACYHYASLILSVSYDLSITSLDHSVSCTVLGYRSRYTTEYFQRPHHCLYRIDNIFQLRYCMIWHRPYLGACDQNLRILSQRGSMPKLETEMGAVPGARPASIGLHQSIGPSLIS